MEQSTKIRGPHDIKADERYTYKDLRTGKWLLGIASVDFHSVDKSLHRIVPPDELPDLDDGTVLVNVANDEQAIMRSAGYLYMDGLSFDATSLDAQSMMFALISLPETKKTKKCETCHGTGQVEVWTSGGYRHEGSDCDCADEPETVDREPRVGDLVVCVDDSDMSDGHASRLVKGQTYRVEGVIGGCFYIEPESGQASVDRRKERFRVLANQPADGSFHRSWAFYDSDRDGWSVGMSSDFRIHSQDGKYENANGPYQVKHDGTRYWDNGSVLARGIFSDDLPGGGPNEPWSDGFEVGK